MRYIARHGLLVKRDNFCFARRRSGFDSLTVHQPERMLWGFSSIGRASRWQCEGQGFDPLKLHEHDLILKPLDHFRHNQHKDVLYNNRIEIFLLNLYV